MTLFNKIPIKTPVAVVTAVLLGAGSFGVAAATGTFSSAPADFSDSSLTSIVSSESEGNNMSAELDAIQQATDNGVSQIQEAADSAVQKVQQAASTTSKSSSSTTVESSSSTSGVTHKTHASGQIIIHIQANSSVSEGSSSSTPTDPKNSAFDCKISVSQIAIDSDNNVITMIYGGTFGIHKELYNADGLKAAGVTLKDASGNSVDYANGGQDGRIKFSYTDISKISSMTLNYGDQHIDITIS